VSDARLLKYSQCMRDHGLPKFPDPTSNGSLNINAREDGITAQDLRRGNRFCQYLLPGLGHPPSQADLERAESGALKYTQCMRDHGLPKFPDPQISNGAILFGSVGPNTARYESAQNACQSLLPENVPYEWRGG
jgi:hypothetical protein